MPPEGPAKPRKKKRPPFSTLIRIGTVIPVRRSLVTLVCLVIAGAAEGFGVASLLPLVAVIGGDGGQPKGFSAKIVEAVHSVGLEPTLGLFLALLIGGMTVKAVLTLIAQHRIGRAVADVAMQMRLLLIDSLLAARWSYYVRQPGGRFAAALGSEATNAGEAYNFAARFVAEVIEAITYAAIATLFSWRLGLLALVVGLVMVLTLNRFMTIAKKTSVLQKRHLRKLIAGLADLLGGIKPMKAMGRHARFQKLFERDANQIRKAQRKQNFAREANKALQDPILAICLAAGIYVAVSVYGMDPGHVVVMALLLARTVTAIGKAQQALQGVRIAQSGFLGMADAIDMARAMREDSRGGREPTFERGAEFRDVYFGFSEVEIIRGASFETPRGHVTTITGTSGAGKTTMVDLLLGLHEPTRGQILIDGVPLPELDLVAWRRMTGYVPQELMLFHDTLRSNVTLGQPEFTDEDVARALEQAGAADFVAQLPEGVETIVGERGARLSGGQRQRIAIARALIHRPKLLILDEATTALDPETEANIVRNVVELARSTGLTVLAISHQPAWERASDNVVRLARGKIVAIDRPGSGWSTARDDDAARAAADGLA